MGCRLEVRMDTIDHVAAVIEDIDKAVEWYTTQFNCEVEWHDTSWALNLLIADLHWSDR